MQVEFGRLVTALGQAVSEAQRAVAAHAIGNYLAYLPRGPPTRTGARAMHPTRPRSCSPHPPAERRGHGLRCPW